MHPFEVDQDVTAVARPPGRRQHKRSRALSRVPQLVGTCGGRRGVSAGQQPGAFAEGASWRAKESSRQGLGRVGVANSPAPDVTVMVGEGLTVTGSTPMGAVYGLDGLWRQLGIDTALRQVPGARRFTTDVERVLFALVANRAIDPLSKLAAAQWAVEDVSIPGLAGMDEDQAYRARDLLADETTLARVQEAVFFAVATLLNLEVDFISSDTTSMYWERDTEDRSMRMARRGSARTGIRSTTARTCSRSSSAWR